LGVENEESPEKATNKRRLGIFGGLRKPYISKLRLSVNPGLQKEGVFDINKNEAFLANQYFIPTIKTPTKMRGGDLRIRAWVRDTVKKREGSSRTA